MNSTHAIPSFLPPAAPPPPSYPSYCTPLTPPVYTSSTSSSRASSSEVTPPPAKKRGRRKKASSSINPNAIVSRAFDREGCRKLQAELDKKGVIMTTAVLSALGDKLPRLMTHPYGNYLFQKLVETATTEQRRLIVRLVRESDGKVQQTASWVPAASNSMQGTRCVQCLIKVGVNAGSES